MAAATRDYFARLTELAQSFLDYGRDFKKHLSELIAHKHGPRKESFELAEEMTLETFFDYLREKNYL